MHNINRVEYYPRKEHNHAIFSPNKTLPAPKKLPKGRE